VNPNPKKRNHARKHQANNKTESWGEPEREKRGGPSENEPETIKIN